VVLVVTKTIVINITHTWFLNPKGVIVLINASNTAERFFIEPNTIKWTFGLTSWPFESFSNVLRLSVGFVPDGPIVTTQFVNSSPIEKVARYEFFTENGEFRVTFPLFAVADYSLLSLPNLYNIDSKSSVTNRTFEFTLPSFVNSLEYDPDMSVLSVTDGAGINSPSGQINLPAIYTASILCGLVLVSVVVVLVVLFVRWMTKMKKKEEKWKGIKFESEDVTHKEKEKEKERDKIMKEPY